MRRRLSRLPAALAVKPIDLIGPDQVLQLGVRPNRIDLVTSIAGVTFEEAWARRAAGDYGGVPSFYIDADSLIRNKLATGRPGRRGATKAPAALTRRGVAGGARWSSVARTAGGGEPRPYRAKIDSAYSSSPLSPS